MLFPVCLDVASGKIYPMSAVATMALKNEWKWGCSNGKVGGRGLMEGGNHEWR